MSSDLHGNPVAVLRPRILVAMWLIGFAFMALVSRVYTLQVLRGEELTQKGEKMEMLIALLPIKLYHLEVLNRKFGRLTGVL